MNQNFSILLLLMIINVFIGSNGIDFLLARQTVEVAELMVSAESKRRSEERRLIDAECSPARCKLSINMSALAKSEEFSDIIEDYDEVEALHIRFEGVRVPPTYDRHRRNASAAASVATMIEGAGSGSIAQIIFRSDAGGTVEGSLDWKVFDPLWWMWARNRRHYAFTMPLLDLDILSVGFLTFGIRELTVETTSEPKGCEQNMSATCLDAYLAEFVRELTAPIRALQNRAVDDQKSQAESEGSGGGRGQSARDRSESTATQRPTTPIPSQAPERLPLGRDNSDVLCQSGLYESPITSFGKVILCMSCKSLESSWRSDSTRRNQSGPRTVAPLDLRPNISSQNNHLRLITFILGSTLPILLFVLLVLLQMDSTPTSVYWKLFRLWLPYEEHPTSFFEFVPTSAQKSPAGSPTTSFSPTPATGAAAGESGTVATMAPGTGGALGGSQKGSSSQVQVSPCHWIVIHEDKSLMQYESRVRLFSLWQRSCPSPEKMLLMLTIAAVLSSAVCWYLAYLRKLDVLASFENGEQVIMNLYSVPFAWIYTRNNWAQYVSACLPALLALGIAPTVIWWIVEFVALARFRRSRKRFRRSASTKSANIEDTVETPGRRKSNARRSDVRDEIYAKKEDPAKVKAAEEEEQKARDQALLNARKAVLGPYTKRSSEDAKSHKSRWNFLERINPNLAIRILKVYFLLLGFIMYIGIYSIFHTVIYVAIGIVVKVEVFAPIVTGLVMVVYYVNRSIQRVISKYTRLKRTLFKRGLEVCAYEARMCLYDPIDRTPVDEIGEWRLQTATLQQVVFYDADDEHHLQPLIETQQLREISAEFAPPGRTVKIALVRLASTIVFVALIVFIVVAFRTTLSKSTKDILFASVISLLSALLPQLMEMVSNSECEALRDEALELRLNKFIAQQRMNFHVLKSPQCTHDFASVDPNQPPSYTVEDQNMLHNARHEFLLGNEKAPLSATNSIPLFENPLNHTVGSSDRPLNGTGASGTGTGEQRLFGAFVKLPQRKPSSGRASPISHERDNALASAGDDRLDQRSGPGVLTRNTSTQGWAGANLESVARDTEMHSTEMEMRPLQPPQTTLSPTSGLAVPTPSTPAVCSVPAGSAATTNQLSSTGPGPSIIVKVDASPTVSFTRGASPVAALQQQRHRLLQKEISLADTPKRRTDDVNDKIAAFAAASPDGAGDGVADLDGGQTQQRLRCDKGRLQRRFTMLARRTAAARSMLDGNVGEATNEIPADRVPLAAAAPSRADGPDESAEGLRKSRQSTRFEYEMQLQFIKC